MTPPNYFRWIKSADSNPAYGGKTLQHDEGYEDSTWGLKTTAPSYTDLQLDEGYEDSTWGLKTTAPSYTDLQHDEDYVADGSAWPTFIIT